MENIASRWAPLLFLTICSAAGVSQNGEPSKSKPDVFVVGEHSATAGIATDFTPTHLPLPDGRLSERGRRELIRDLESEQGFAHRVLPMGPGLLLEANGELTPGAVEYKKMIYEKGASVSVGDRVVVTALAFKGDRMVVDVNGGPYAKHRYLSHVSFGDAPVARRGEDSTGARVTLIFKGGIPEISAPEVKALLAPVIDFGAKTSTDAYADTLPAPVKESIAAHEVLVGMDRRMVLASAGAPESKVREHIGGDAEAAFYEEWIYGHVPQTVRFVRFKDDTVVLVKIAALGKPIEIHDKNELGDFAPEPAKRDIALGDGVDPDRPVGPPTLRQPGEAAPTANSANRVQYPPPGKPTPIPAPPQDPSAGSPPSNFSRQD
jgi:hypothetical protein